jgi:glycosyltransferase involved in cell wall biosynthesis
MPTALQTYERIATRDDTSTLNVLTFCTHERYETGLAKTGHRFYAWQGPNIKGWNTKYAPIPSNYHILDGRKLDSQLPLWVDVDLVLSQNKFAQYEVAAKVARQLQCPLITLEHTLPSPKFLGGMRKYLQSLKGDLDLFISDYSIEQWGWDKGEKVDVIHHGVDTDLFIPSDQIREDLVCSVVNDWMNRDWCCGFNLWRQVTNWPETTLPLNVWGDTKGLSTSAPDVPSLVREYQRSKIFLNTSLISPVPTVLLEAMSCGCAVVSTDTCMIPEFIKHGENGFMGKTAHELRYYVDLLRKDDKLASEMGNAARKTIVDNFSMNKFVSKWKEVFRRMI